MTHRSDCLQPTTVLVVDDYPDTAEVVAQMLELRGFRATAALDGQEALDMAYALRPNVILLDIELPKISGVEVCRALRKEPWGAAMVIVAVTGHAGTREAEWIMSAGFDWVLAKPCSYRHIETVLHSIQGLVPPPDGSIQPHVRADAITADASSS